MQKKWLLIPIFAFLASACSYVDDASISRSDPGDIRDFLSGTSVNTGATSPVVGSGSDSAVLTGALSHTGGEGVLLPKTPPTAPKTPAPSGEMSAPETITLTPSELGASGDVQDAILQDTSDADVKELIDSLFDSSNL